MGAAIQRIDPRNLLKFYSGYDYEVVTQLGERLNGIQVIGGSIPPVSTKVSKRLTD
tara:strand:- start:774 stop:941 length:168 start_codon:yes stop_codon:yes gene_type:complete